MFLAILGLLQSKKKSGFNQSVFFFKKKTFFNNKKQNISNQSSGVIGPTDLLVKQLQTNVLSFLIENLWSFLFLKIIDLSINNGLIKFFSTFFLNLYNFQLNVSKKRPLLLCTYLTLILSCSFKPEIIVFWL